MSLKSIPSKNQQKIGKKLENFIAKALGEPKTSQLEDYLLKKYEYKDDEVF